MASDTFTHFSQQLYSIFGEDIVKVYQDLRPSRRKRMLPHLPGIYRRWLYSTLIENIRFSPSNILDCLAYNYKIKPNTYMVATYNHSKENGLSFNYKPLTYFKDAHPIVDDLKVLLKFCAPHVDLCEDWALDELQKARIAKKLSINDPYYASFLLEIACRLGLMDKMPSLYVQRMQVTDRSNDILAQPCAELIDQIIDTAIDYAVDGLQGALPAPVSMFTKSGIRSLLVNPVSTDSIFEQVFNTLGFNIDELLTVDIFRDIDDGFDDSDAMGDVVSGIFILGIMLDRFFFTPFGYFLRLISPIYSMPLDIKDEIQHYLDATEYDADDGFAAFFAPCASYTLTDLGLQILETTPTEHNYFDSSEVLTAEVLNNPIFTTSKGIRLFIESVRKSIPISEMPDSIYTFRVAVVDNPTVWIHVQIPKSANMHQLYEEVADFFCMDDNINYTFYHSKEVNQFTEYVGVTDIKNVRKLNNSRSKPGPPKKHTHIPLNMLDFEHMKHMVLVFDNPYVKQFSLELIKETAKEPRKHYPNVSKLSKGAREQLEAFDFM